jgi:hypothetical protein
MLSGIVGAFGAVGMSVFDQDALWLLFFYGYSIEFLGLALFGFANLSQRVMPRGNVLPLLAGIWVPLYVLASLIVEQASGSWVEFPLLVDVALFGVTTAGLVGLGFVLQSEQAKPAVPSAAVA